MMLCARPAALRLCRVIHSSRPPPACTSGAAAAALTAAASHSNSRLLPQMISVRLSGAAAGGGCMLGCWRAPACSAASSGLLPSSLLHALLHALLDGLVEGALQPAADGLLAVSPPASGEQPPLVPPLQAVSIAAGSPEAHTPLPPLPPAAGEPPLLIMRSLSLHPGRIRGKTHCQQKLTSDTLKCPPCGVACHALGLPP